MANKCHIKQPVSKIRDVEDTEYLWLTFMPQFMLLFQIPWHKMFEMGTLCFMTGSNATYKKHKFYGLVLKEMNCLIPDQYYKFKELHVYYLAVKVINLTYKIR